LVEEAITTMPSDLTKKSEVEAEEMLKALVGVAELLTLTERTALGEEDAMPKTVATYMPPVVEAL
jgi:hypothetical protein